MKPADAFGVLTVLEQFQYVDDKEVSAQAWAEALDEDMPAEWAVRSINAFFGNPVLMRDGGAKMNPGLLNGEWREKKRSMYERQALESSTPAHRVPMPYWFRAAMVDAFGIADLDGITTDEGRRKKSKGEVQAIFDAAMRNAGITPESAK